MEMMENYEETRICTSHKDHCDLHDLNIHDTNLSANCTTLMVNKQNFNFGAEIVGTKTIEVERECDVKTKHENNIATNATLATVAVAASSMPDIGPQVGDIETPLKISELPTNNESNQIDDDNDIAEDDDDGDSYQSEDDVDDANAESQQESIANMHNDGSQDSDESTSDSDFSDLSGLSEMSGREWKPISARPINWVQKQIHAGANPRDLLSQMLPSNAQPIAPGVNDMLLWRFLASMLSEPPRRQKLRYVNTFEDVIQLIQQSKNIIVLTGAGVSVSCGIPDFRSSDGIYSRLAKDFPNLPDPQAMFDINYFSRDPRPFFKFAREIYPGQFKPSPCHRFIKLLEEKQKLLRNYTQNIDTLEQVAGIKNVIECHGSFSTASCTKCKVKCTADAIREDIFSQRIPVCRRCQPNVHQSVNASDAVSDENLRLIVENGIMKPDIVFFGEGLPEEFHNVMASDKDRCDLLIVIGSSLKVRPVALIPSSIPANVPQILINREQLHHLEFDVELLGDSDVIINQVCHRLGNDWKEICYNNTVLKESKELLPLEEIDTNDESEEDAQQMLDTDTQSVKSSTSTDLALRSAGTYSDSGFESSTSSGMVLAKPTPIVANNIEAKEAIEKIKTTMLELNQPSTATTTTKLKHQNNNLDRTRVDYLDERNNAVDFENGTFQPFNIRVTEQTRTATSYGMNVRHLSIDSSKDSGIHGDSSNSALNPNIVGSLLPPVTNFGGTTSVAAINDCSVTSIACVDNLPTPTAPTTTTKVATKTITKTDASQTTNIKNEGDCEKNSKKYRTASERLLEGTYYVHETSSAYVFPGAQVSWWSDAEDEDDQNDIIIGNEYDEDEENGMDANGAPLSPLMPPSVEAEVVSEITTTSAFAICAKPTMLSSSSIANGVVSDVNAIQNTSNKTLPTPAAKKINACSLVTQRGADDTRIRNIIAPLADGAEESATSSPQKRECECPSTVNSNYNETTTHDSESKCCSSNSIGKCECSPPPLKRKRSIDDGNAMLFENQLIKNLNVGSINSATNIVAVSLNNVACNTPSAV